ncbi:ParA family protein [Flexithrix dorotheae]|uniref:ParA family protein n=1 Tax=Flexithrix dorotheae TaxID=70993 RepID=UPI00036493D2|nr:ParA family protein [Flexithrix dorotheae]
MTVISILNHKGGTGKTTTTVNLGKALALQGKKVLIVDIDSQSNLSQHVGVESPSETVYDALCKSENLPVIDLGDNLHLVPANLELAGADDELRKNVNGYFRLRESFKAIQSNYDFILIDCPPSLEILTINALIASSEVIIPTQSQYFSIKGLQTIFELIEELKQNLNPTLKIKGILLTQVNNTVINKTIQETVHEGYGDLVFKTFIRQNVALTEASYSNQTIFDYQSKSQGAEDYFNLSKEILNG